MPGQTPPAELRAGCKINLFLDILERLENGYHTLRTLFIPLPEPADTLICLPREQEFTVRCETPGIDPLRNTLTKAYQLYAEASGFAPGLLVELKKGIPHGAGLGGGSADAAALLRYLQQHAGPAALSEAALNALAGRVGADVPFFLQDRPALAEGIGERLSSVDWAELPVSGMTLVLVCPDLRVSTAWAYTAWDEAENKEHTRTLTALPGEGTRAFRSSLTEPGENFSWLRNSLEPVVFAAHPELAALRAQLVQRGAAATLMSGSGSSVFGLFRDRNTALEAATAFAFEKKRVFMHDFPVQRPGADL